MEACASYRVRVWRRKKFKSIRKVEGRSNEQFKDDHAFKEFQESITSSKLRPRLWRVWRYEKTSSMTTTPLKSSKSKTGSIGSWNWFDWRFIYYKSEVDRSGNSLGLIFIYYKSEVAGRSGREIRSTDLHLLQVRGLQVESGPEICWTDLQLLQVPGLRPIGSGNSDKTNSQKTTS